PARAGRGPARRACPPDQAPLGRGLQRGGAGRGRTRAVSPRRGRAGRGPGHRPRRARPDLCAGDRRGDVPLMTRITVACLDMAGTTVADDGTVLAAFTAAITEQNLPVIAFSQAMKDVRSSMGQSKIEVFRRILGDDAAAARANEAFEDHYGAAVGRGEVAAMPGAEQTFAALRDAGTRADLEQAGAPLILDTIAGLLPHVTDAG